MDYGARPGPENNGGTVLLVYEVPASPHLLLDTSGETVAGSAGRVVALLTACRLVAAELPTAGR